MYSDLYIKHRFQNKNLIAVVSAVILFVIVFFVAVQDSSPTRASKLNILEHQIVNISPHEFGVLWQLDEADSGWLIYGKTRNKMNEIIFDERDKATSKSKRKYHFASITNLEPGTKYFYRIISNNQFLHREIMICKSERITFYKFRILPIRNSFLKKRIIVRIIISNKNGIHFKSFLKHILLWTFCRSKSFKIFIVI